MRLHDPGLCPKPLPPHAGLLARLEHVLQWLVYLLVIRIEDKPALSGCLSGLAMGIPIWLLFWLLFHL
jgi:hypothetical protein